MTHQWQITNQAFKEALEIIADEDSWNTETGTQVLGWIRQFATATRDVHFRRSGWSAQGHVPELVADAWEFIESRGPLELSREPSPIGLLHRVMERSLWRIATAETYMTDKSKATHPSRLKAQVGSFPCRVDDLSQIEELLPVPETAANPVLGRREAVHTAVKNLIDGLVTAGMPHERATRVVGRAWEIMENHSRASQRIHTAAYADPELCADLGRHQIRALIDLMCGPRRTPDGTSALAVMIEAELNATPISVESATLTASRDLAVLAETADPKSLGRAA